MVIMASVATPATTLCLNSVRTWLPFGINSKLWASASELRHEPVSKRQLSPKLMCVCVCVCHWKPWSMNIRILHHNLEGLAVPCATLPLRGTVLLHSVSWVTFFETNFARNPGKWQPCFFPQESLTTKPLQSHKPTTKPELFNRCLLSSCVTFQVVCPFQGLGPCWFQWSRGVSDLEQYLKVFGVLVLANFLENMIEFRFLSA